jgi:hypothetical protein
MPCIENALAGPSTSTKNAICIAVALIAGVVSTGCGERPEPTPVSNQWQRVDASGHILSAASSGEHHCVLDPRTGLMWQVRHATGGLHDPANRYSWYSEDRAVNMSEPGSSDGGRCEGSNCDTRALVEAVNREGLCGYYDWQMPDREQLLSLGDERLRRTGLIVDADFFPGVTAGEYWTSETFRLYPQSAWAVSFGNGLDRADLKTEAKSVRLVRRHGPPTDKE